MSLSEQQLVDCSRAEGNEGCNGGLMDNAFTYAENNAIELESEYPYKAYDGTCKAKNGKVKVASFQDVTPNDPGQLKAAVAKGPVSIAIQADSYVFQGYSHGVMNDASCGTQLDHGVAIVGYGEEKGQAYWLVRNSWGSGWGDKGYIKIANTGKKDEGICGINMAASYPVIA